MAFLHVDWDLARHARTATSRWPSSTCSPRSSPARRLPYQRGGDTRSDHALASEIRVPGTVPLAKPRGICPPPVTWAETGGHFRPKHRECGINIDGHARLAARSNPALSAAGQGSAEQAVSNVDSALSKHPATFRRNAWSLSPKYTPQAWGVAATARAVDTRKRPVHPTKAHLFGLDRCLTGFHWRRPSSGYNRVDPALIPLPQPAWRFTTSNVNSAVSSLAAEAERSFSMSNGVVPRHAESGVTVGFFDSVHHLQA
jgi:hypothetical protein